MVHGVGDLGVAVFLAELAPAWLRRPMGFMVELLAAIPSVVYGLWGIFLLNPWLSPLSFFGAIVVFFGIGVWACERTGRELGIPDHGAMNWDEVVAMLLVLMFTPEHWAWWGLAFVAFRFFDVVKPPPIRYVDRKVKGGLGVMSDDIVAAFYTLLVLAAVKQILG